MFFGWFDQFPSCLLQRAGSDTKSGSEKHYKDYNPGVTLLLNQRRFLNTVDAWHGHTRLPTGTQGNDWETFAV